MCARGVVHRRPGCRGCDRTRDRGVHLRVRAVRQRARLDDRRDARWARRRMVRRHARRRERRRHLVVATRRRKVDAACRSRDGRAAGRLAVPDVESGSLRAAQGRAGALLQGRPESSRMVGHGAHVFRRGSNVERCRDGCPTESWARSRTNPCAWRTERSSRRAAPKPPTRRAPGACTSNAPATPARHGACRVRRPRREQLRSTPSSQAS